MRRVLWVLSIFSIGIAARPLYSDKDICKKAFVERLVIDEHFGYTFFGNKPLSFTHFWRYVKMEDPIMNYGYLSTIKTLPKISDNCIFVKLATNDYIEIRAINVREALNIIEKHKDKFAAILIRKDANQLILDLATALCLDDVLDYNDELFGLLLGYGEHNAHAFNQRNAAPCIILAPKLPDEHPRFSLELPRFMSFDDEETRDLQRSYTSDIQKTNAWLQDYRK